MSQILHEQSSPPDTSVEDELGSMSIALTASVSATTVEVRRAARRFTVSYTMWIFLARQLGSPVLLS